MVEADIRGRARTTSGEDERQFVAVVLPAADSIVANLSRRKKGMVDGNMAAMGGHVLVGLGRRKLPRHYDIMAVRISLERKK